jgi:hypothetical protein
MYATPPVHVHLAEKLPHTHAGTEGLQHLTLHAPKNMPSGQPQLVQSLACWALSFIPPNKSIRKDAVRDKLLKK